MKPPPIVLDRKMRKGARYYEMRIPTPDGEIIEITDPGSTSVLGILAKPGLDWWQQNQPIEYMLEYWEICKQIIESDMHIIAKRNSLRNLIKEYKFAGAYRGTSVHEIIEALLRGEPLPKESDDPRYDGFKKKAYEMIEFLGLAEPIFVEAPLFNRELGYAGTADLITKTERWGLALIDHKTSKRSKTAPFGCYLEYFYQTVSYAMATERLTDEGELVPFTKPDSILIANIQPDEPFAIQELDPALWDRAFEHFVCALRLFQDEKRGDDYFKIAPVIQESE